MSLIRNVSLTMACSGMVVAAPMAQANSTSGSVPAFSVSAVGQNNDDNGGGTRVRPNRWILWVGAIGLIIVGGIIVATISR